MNRAIRTMMGLAAGAVTLAGALPASASGDYRPVKRRVQAMPIGLGDSFSAFTPAAGDPRKAADFARSGLGARGFSGGAFRFTPSGTTAARRAVTVAVRARAVPRTEAARLASIGVAPSAYNLGVAIGWKRFALSGDVARIEGGMLPDGRESAEIGLGYAGNRWNTRLAVGADRTIGERALMIGQEEGYSASFGGSYALTRNLDVTGGVRYRLQRERLAPAGVDATRDSQAVYLGTTFRF